MSGPKVVAVGGGHGLAATLRAVRRYAGAITAVVSVADDGGSSGRLRADLGVPPPGDLRRCLSALASEDSMLGHVLEYRFPGGDLADHALGNLLIAGLAGAGPGFVAALDEVGRLVGAAGRVLPAATVPVSLTGLSGPPGNGQGPAVRGQVAVQNTAGIRTLELRPPDPATPEEVVDAIAGADQIVIGPGSLYTSVLAAAVVPRVRAALAAASGQRVYVCNLRPQVPETEGYTAADHLLALQRHQVPVDVMVCHGAGGGSPTAGVGGGARVVEADLARPHGLAHDPDLLGRALSELAGAVA